MTRPRRSLRSSLSILLRMDPFRGGTADGSASSFDDDATVVMPARRACASSRPAHRSRSRRAPIAARSRCSATAAPLTIVNELPLEEYLRGVVPNELNPAAFGQTRSAQGAGGGRPHLHPAEPGPVQARGLRHLRDRRVSGVLRRAHGRSARDPGGHRDARRRRHARAGSRSTRSTARRAAAGPRTPNTSSANGCRTWFPRAASTNIPAAAVRIVAVGCRIGRTACWPWRASRTSPRPRGSWACRTAREPASMEPAALSAFIRQTFYPSVMTASICRSSASRGSCRRQVAAAAGAAFPAHRQEGDVRMAAGGARVVGRAEDAAHGERAAEGVRAQSGRAHLPAHRR